MTHHLVNVTLYTPEYNVSYANDKGDESFDYKFAGRDVDADNIGKTVGEKLLNLAGNKFKRR